MTTAQKILNNIIADSVTPVLKPEGFRKSSMNFHRRNKDVVQVVNFQSSRGSTHEEILFYVNIGLAFDEICELSREDILEKPKVHECDSRGTRGRLETLLSNVPDSWTVNVRKPPSSLSKDLKSTMGNLVRELNQIESVATYNEHRWFNRFRPKPENAQIFYILGDLEASKEEVEKLCVLFADRKSANQPEWWAAKLGLEKLGDS